MGTVPQRQGDAEWPPNQKEKCRGNLVAEHSEQNSLRFMAWAWARASDMYYDIKRATRKNS